MAKLRKSIFDPKKLMKKVHNLLFKTRIRKNQKIRTSTKRVQIIGVKNHVYFCWAKNHPYQIQKPPFSVQLEHWLIYILLKKTELDDNSLIVGLCIYCRVFEALFPTCITYTGTIPVSWILGFPFYSQQIRTLSSYQNFSVHIFHYFHFTV